MDATAGELIRRVNRMRKRTPITGAVLASLLCAAFLLFVLLADRSAPLAASVSLACLTTAVLSRRPLRRVDAERRSVRLVYPSGSATWPVVRSLNQAFQVLAGARTLWPACHPADLQSPLCDVGGTRPPVAVSPPHLITSQPAWLLPGRDRDFYFLPDRVLIFEGRTCAGSLSYDGFEIRLDGRTYEGCLPPAGARIFEQQSRDERAGSRARRLSAAKPQKVKAHLGQITILVEGAPAAGWIVTDTAKASVFCRELRQAQQYASELGVPRAVIDPDPLALIPLVSPAAQPSSRIPEVKYWFRVSRS